MEQSIVTQLAAKMKERNIKIPRLATLLGIPKDRMYKWFQQGTNPKEEDAIKIRQWLYGENMDNIPHETVIQEKPPPEYGNKDELIKSLKQTINAQEKTLVAYEETIRQLKIRIEELTLEFDRRLLQEKVGG